MKTILITGGGGFIGSNLAEGLIARGSHRVVICDRFGANRKWQNVLGVPVWEILPPEALAGWLAANASKLEAIYHLGGISSTTEQDAGLLLEANYRLSLSLWQWCAAKGVRFFYISSYATYGDGSQGFDDDGSLATLQRLRPLSPHGWSKHAFDMYAAQAVAAGDPVPPQWTGLKMFNTYGPREAHKEDQRSVICKMIDQAMHAGSVRLFRSLNPAYPDGAQQRDVVYVKDVVAVMAWLLDHPQTNGLFNLGTGQARTFHDMAKAVFAALGKESRIQFIDMPEAVAPSYQYFTEARMDRLRAAGYTAPFTSLEEGVRDYVLNYKAKV